MAAPKTPKRKALLIAISYHSLAEQYRGHHLHLKGTHRDPNKVYHILRRYGFDHHDITILMDDQKGQYPQPTRDHMLRAMEDLVKDAAPGDSFVFHFSGHGSQVKNWDKSEDDGFDEVLWPCDVQYDPKLPEAEDVDNYIKDDDLITIPT